MTRRMILVLSLLLFPALALADDATSTAPTTPLLQAIERAAGVASAPQALPVFGGKVLPKSDCTVSVTCFPSCTLSCMGTVCSGTTSSITCDGNTEVCPPRCTWPNHCVDVCGYCECRAAGGGASFCALQNC